MSAFVALHAESRGIWTREQATEFLHGVWNPAEHRGWPEFIASIRERRVGTQQHVVIQYAGRSTVIRLNKATPERLSALSDGIFAVLITVLVLDLHPPTIPSFKALLTLWPTWVSYAVSYLFIAIVWTNHHYLMRYATEANSRLLWVNFAHLFSMSLLPLSTAWMAVSELAPQPVAFYAAVFFLVNATYIGLIWELIDESVMPPKLFRIMQVRSIATLCVFGAASAVALKLPRAALGLCICCLIVYLRPAPSASQ